jgi:tetratricopeptide (TPR) repeat protein
MRLFFIIILGLIGLAAHADELTDKERTERARAHFEMGRAHFNLGEYEAAVREFEEGYRLKPQPLFLYNLGNAARRAGQLQKALVMFQRYLAERPDAPERKEVLSRIDELKREIAETPKIVEPPPKVVEPPPKVVEPSLPSPSPAPPLDPYADLPPPSPVIVIPPPSPEPIAVRPVDKKNWRHDWLGATLCAVGGGVLLYSAIDFGVRYSAYDADVTAMHNAHNYQDALDAVNRANGRAPYLTADVILLPVGAVLVVAGAIRYAVLARRH